jgi:hypothetical protein
MAAGGTTPQITLATGGAVTLTGALNGTSASFTGNISASSMITVSYGDIDTGNNRGIRIVNTDSSEGTAYNITSGRAGQNNGDFVIRNTTTGVNNLFFNRTTGAATFSSSVTATSFVIPNGQFYRATRTSGSLITDMIGIPSGTNDVRVLTTGAFSIVSGGLSPFLHITDAGNVGIGTASPTTYSLAGRHLEVNDAGGGFAFLHNNTTSVKSFFAANESGGLAALFTFSNHPLTFGTNNTERMRITSGGDLLIGQNT